MRYGTVLGIGLAALAGVAGAQGTPDAVSGYRMPPAPIPQMIDALPTPAVLPGPDHRMLAIVGREGLPSNAALARPILRLAGFRIDPATNGQAEIRSNWLTALSFQDVASRAVHRIALPAGSRFTNIAWSPNARMAAFVMQRPDGLDLWVVDAGANGVARRVASHLNAAFGTPFEWLPDSSGLLIRQVPAARGAAPAAPAAPSGPIVQQSGGGRISPGRTYEDLLSDAHDEALFDHYFAGQLAIVSASGVAPRPVGAVGLIPSFDVSPDGRYILVERLKRPYSYTLPADAFPTEVAVWSIAGKPLKTLADRPLADDVPVDFDAVVKGPRDVEWRSDAPATLVWAEAQDGGDPKAKVAVHDRLFAQAAPFDAAPVALADLSDRYARVFWGRGDTAMLVGRWWKTRTERRLVFDPGRPGSARLIATRNYQDQYGDPGSPAMTTNAAGHRVMQFTPDGKALFMLGDGATKAGEFPFLARQELADGKATRLWTAQAPYYESPIALLDDAGARLLTRRETRIDAPNYFVRTVAGGTVQALTDFKDPEPQFAGVTRQTIVYKRADGLSLSGNLYLPAGYDARRDGPLPTLLWAYPAEFTDPRVAGQTVDRGNRFTRPVGISHLFLLTQGYAILDNPAMPIVGANGAEPNDSYVQQLTDDARAAIDAVVAMGVTDRARVAIGGHSYGAFMTANLLAHTDLFRAGIARSGAYNRTLTPFGFQAEQRNYWQATDVYTQMSPFTFADRIKAPILLIHGQADDNPGTFPIQSERFYAALKGNGASVRYVVLPNEPHGYRGRESTMHVLWEMASWLDTHVKPKTASTATVAAR